MLSIEENLSAGFDEPVNSYAPEATSVEEQETVEGK